MTDTPPGPTPRRRSGRALVIIGAIALLGALGFAGLGIWQLERLAWKTALIAAVEERTTAVPTDPSADGAWTRFEPDRDEYRRVTVTGSFDLGAETLVQAVTVYGGGFWVMVPLQLADGGSILVNRGFVPLEQRSPVTRETPDGPVSVTGLLRQTEPNGGFLRSNDPAAERWYSRDVAAIAAHLGLGDTAPFFIDAAATPAGTYPIGGLTVLSFSNNHLIYALTWFVLALMLLAAFIFILRDRWRSR